MCKWCRDTACVFFDGRFYHPTYGRFVPCEDQNADRRITNKTMTQGNKVYNFYTREESVTNPPFEGLEYCP